MSISQSPVRPMAFRPKTKDELAQQVIAMGERGDPHKWITAETGLAMSTVSQILRRAGLGRYTSSLDRKPLLQLALEWAASPYSTDLHRLITHRRFPYGKLPSSTDTNAFVLKTLSAEIARLTHHGHLHQEAHPNLSLSSDRHSRPDA